MSVKPESLDHVRRARPICARQSRQPRKCYACGAPATILCDHPKEVSPEDAAQLVEAFGEAGAAEHLTCSRPCCAAHACYWTKGKQLCREHAEELGVWA